MRFAAAVADESKAAAAAAAVALGDAAVADYRTSLTFAAGFA